jgi:hypothetical protein
MLGVTYDGYFLSYKVLKVDFLWISDPFNANCGNNLPLDAENILIVPSTACILRDLRRVCPLEGRWIKTYTEYPHLIKKALNTLHPFSSEQLYESILFAIAETLGTPRNRLDITSKLRLFLSKFSPRMHVDKICSSMQLR